MKIPWGTWLVLLSLSSLCGCYRSASGHTVRGVTEKWPAINQIHN